MKTLYIIGNGFDLHHGLDTKYQTFAKYLAEIDNEIYDLLLIYYGLPDISKDPASESDYAEWANFESSLANLDYNQVLADNSDAIANPFSADFRDRDWHTYQIYMEEIIEKLTERLSSIFNSFILSVIYPDKVDDKKIKFESDSIFLNFNYTETLEKYYSINNAQICYIHNKSINDDSQIILGHGTDPSNFEEKQPEPPEGLDEKGLEEWEEYMSDQYNYSYESAKSEILSYYTKVFKDTQTIIKTNTDFFEQLNKVKKVFVLGHSISPVDLEYFKLIVKKIDKNAKWNVSYYNDYEKKTHIETLLNLGLVNDNTKQIRIEDLK
jgi:hypothetical protein